MKPRYLFTVIGLLCLLHTSHAQQVRFYYPDSTLSSEGTLREGKPDGFWKTYYPEGTLKSAGNRKNFLLDSVWYFFYQNADTAESIEYRAARKNGYYLKYQQSTPSLKNIVVAKELWLNDKRNGPAFYFHSNGILQMEVRFDDGLKQGDAKVYDETGRLVAI
ncbi:MAG: hypothetical protein RIS47_2271, partial [Bacteroidota bacterium]